MSQHQHDSQHEAQQGTSFNVVEQAFESLGSSLPAVFARSAVPALLGGAISSGTLANLGKEGSPFFILNGHVTYERASFLRWLRSRVRSDKGF